MPDDGMPVEPDKRIPRDQFEGVVALGIARRQKPHRLVRDRHEPHIPRQHRRPRKDRGIHHTALDLRDQMRCQPRMDTHVKIAKLLF